MLVLFLKIYISAILSVVWNLVMKSRFNQTGAAWDGMQITR